MRLLPIKKTILPITTFTMLMGMAACNNSQTSYAADEKSTRTAIDFTQRGFGFDIFEQDFDSLVDPYALNKIQIENNIDSELAWREFKAEGENNTAMDSIAMYDIALQHADITDAIDYLRAVAAVKGFEIEEIDPYYDSKTQNEMNAYLKDPNAQKLYYEFKDREAQLRASELSGQE